jgi:copper(I)-binding protein
LIVGVAEIAWALAFWRRPSTALYRAGLALAGGLIVLWAITRVLPAPFEHEPGPVDAFGVVCKGSEFIGVLGLATLALLGRLAEVDRAPVQRVIGEVLALSLVGLASYGVGLAAEPLLPALGARAEHAMVEMGEGHHEMGTPESPGRQAGTVESVAVVGSVQIGTAWSRPAIAGGNGAVYLTLVNQGPKSDRLTSVRADVAEAELHQMTMEGGVMKMQPISGGIEVPAGGKVELKPGGLHVMLIGLRKDLKAGDTFPITLRFQDAGEVSVQVKVLEQ